MNKKMGRPKLPKGEQKAAQVGVRFNPAEEKKIGELADDSEQTKADWVRNAAVAEAAKPPIWIKSKWTLEELNGKLVQFRLSAPNLRIEGVGQFLIRRNPRGELAIDICVERAESPCKIVETRYYLRQEAADKIEANPDQKIAPFRLLG